MINKQMYSHGYYAGQFLSQRIFNIDKNGKNVLCIKEQY